MSFWPTLSTTSRLRRLLAATSASTVVLLRWAIANSESPLWTTYSLVLRDAWHRVDEFFAFHLRGVGPKP